MTSSDPDSDSLPPDLPPDLLERFSPHEREVYEEIRRLLIERKREKDEDNLIRKDE